MVMEGDILFLKRITVLLIMSLLLLGCVTTKPVDPRITVIDNFLAVDISITGVSSVINNSGFIEIQVTGVNKTNFYKQL